MMDFPEDSKRNGWYSQITKRVMALEDFVRRHRAFDHGAGYAQSGTYTPTLFNVTNIAASLPYVTQWFRVADMVTVYGSVNIDPTAAGASELGMSLPIASNLGNASQLAGMGDCHAVAGYSYAIFGDTANKRASFQWVAVDIANRATRFIFSYQIL